MVCFHLSGGFLVRKTRATTVGSFGTKEREKEGEAGHVVLGKTEVRTVTVKKAPLDMMSRS